MKLVYLTPILLLFLIANASAFNQGECNQVISIPGEIVLDQDILGCTSDNIITINENDVILDCQDHVIQGTGSGGIISNKENVIIRNCDIVLDGELSAEGLNLKNAYAHDNNISVTGDYAVSLSSNNLLENNELYSDADNALLITGSDNQVIGNTMEARVNYGISIVNGASNNYIYDNTATSSAASISLQQGCEDNEIIKNTLTGAPVFFKSSNNKLYNNYINLRTSVNDFVFIDSLNIWSTTQIIGERVYSNGAFIGGNFWADDVGTGFSEVCVDSDSNGFCDAAYDLDKNVACTPFGPFDLFDPCENNKDDVDRSYNFDYYPLSDKYTIGIDNIVAKPSDFSARIMWTTSKPTTSSILINDIVYGNDTEYVLEHEVFVDKLVKSTVYPYTLTSCDEYGFCENIDSLELTTSTPYVPPVEPPRPSGGGGSVCRPKWVFVEWSECIDDTQYKIYVDEKECGKTKTPVEERICNVPATYVNANVQEPVMEETFSESVSDVESPEKLNPITGAVIGVGNSTVGKVSLVLIGVLSLFALFALKRRNNSVQYRY